MFLAKFVKFARFCRKLLSEFSLKQEKHWSIEPAGGGEDLFAHVSDEWIDEFDAAHSEWATGAEEERSRGPRLSP